MCRNHLAVSVQERNKTCRKVLPPVLVPADRGDYDFVLSWHRWYRDGVFFINRDEQW